MNNSSGSNHIYDFSVLGGPRELLFEDVFLTVAVVGIVAITLLERSTFNEIRKGSR